MIKTRKLSITVSKEIGKVSAELVTPSDPICVLTIAHGAGAGMNHDFMVSLSKALAEQNIATLRFNFPFMENKKGRPDVPRVAHQTIEAAIKKAQKLFPAQPLFASGKSFGGRMTSQYFSEQPKVEIAGIIFFGFPLHKPGSPSIERGEHLKTVKVPMLFLQGSRDEFGTYELVKKVCTKLRLATVVNIEGANHAFKAGKLDVMPVLAKATRSWIDKKVKSS